MSIEVYAVENLKKINRDICVSAIVPGSKSITNRALLLAAMSEGTSTVRGCLTSDDARHFLECLKTLGFGVTQEPDGGLGSNITITGYGGSIPVKKAEIYVGSAGTAARFLVAMLAFSDGEYTVRSSEQMKKRPMEPLIEALRSAGAKVKCLEEEGHFPLQITGIGRQTESARQEAKEPEAVCESVISDTFTVNIDKSSQFLSALMIAVGTQKKRARIYVTGSHGFSYVDLTAEMMKEFGVTVEKQITGGQISYYFSGKDSFVARNYEVEPDMSAAAYFYAMAAILHASVAVKGIKRHMMQGDAAFLDVLEQMGCRVYETEKGDMAVDGPVCLKGELTVDMSAFSDQALTLAAIAPFADGPVRITGIGHIRLQECDRIRAIVQNLTEMGIRTQEKEDEVTIWPGKPAGAQIETFEDHRVAMSFALTGLRVPGVIIRNPSCCKKTFAEYFTMLEEVTAQLKQESDCE